MQDPDLFLELAGIAGVFVGFGALIAVRSGGASGALEVAPMRAMVSMGVLAIIAALTPVTLARYPLGDHEVWALSSAVILAGWIVLFGAMLRTPEYRAGWAAEIEASRTRSLWIVVPANAVFALYLVTTLVLPVIVLLRAASELEAALYYTDIVMILVGAAWGLLGLVFAQRTAEVP